MKTILVALDCSPRASQVLAAGADLAGRAGAKLVLLRAVPLPVELPAGALVMPPAQLGPLLLDDARASLAALAKEAPPSIPTEARVEVGMPWSVICDEAKRVDADLVVIGSHGYSTLDRLLGTTAARVVNHLDRSVLVVRPREDPRR